MLPFVFGLHVYNCAYSLSSIPAFFKDTKSLKRQILRDNYARIKKRLTLRPSSSSFKLLRISLRSPFILSHSCRATTTKGVRSSGGILDSRSAMWKPSGMRSTKSSKTVRIWEERTNDSSFGSDCDRERQDHTERRFLEISHLLLLRCSAASFGPRIPGLHLKDSSEEFVGGRRQELDLCIWMQAVEIGRFRWQHLIDVSLIAFVVHGGWYRKARRKGHLILQLKKNSVS